MYVTVPAVGRLEDYFILLLVLQELYVNDVFWSGCHIGHFFGVIWCHLRFMECHVWLGQRSHGRGHMSPITYNLRPPARFSKKDKLMRTAERSTRLECLTNKKIKTEPKGAFLK